LGTVLQWSQSHTSENCFVGVFLETVGLPIPGEIVLLSAGAMIFSHSTSLPEVMLAGVLAAVSGDLFLFSWAEESLKMRSARSSRPIAGGAIALWDRHIARNKRDDF